MPTRTTKTPRRVALDKPALFRDLGYEPHPGQLDVHLSRAKRRVLAAGVRFGKTTVGAMETLAALLCPCDESMGWVVGPDHFTADRILKKVQVKLEKYLAHRIVEIDNRRHRIVVRNLGGGLSVVEGRSADNPNSLLGEGLTWLIVDEAARLKAEIWTEHLTQRLVDRDGWALLISTPRGPGWFHRLFARGQGEDPAYESWSRPSADNPLLDVEAIEQERERLPEETFLQEFGGQFVGKGLPLCDVCLFPRQVAKLKPPVFYQREEWQHCSECGRLVCRDGISSVTADGFHLSGILFPGEREDGPRDMD